MRSRWVLGSALAVTVAVVLGAVVALRLGLEPYRKQIEQLVAHSTGRPFQLKGPLRLQLAPLVITLGAAELGNPPDMHGPPFVAWRSARVQLRLLPLLHRRLVIDRVQLHGLEMHLRRTAGGRTNWAGSALRARVGTRVTAERIGALEVHGGTIDWIDEESARHVQLADLQLDAASVRFGPFVEIGPVSLSARARLRAVANGRPRSGRTRSVPDEISLGSADRGGLPFALDVAGIEISRHPLELAISHAGLRLPDERAEGSLTVAGADGNWQARGVLEAQVGSVRQLAAAFGLDLPRMRDAQALGALRLECRWTLAGETLSLESLRARLDDTTLVGRITREAAAGASRIELELHGDHIDLGRYATAGSVPARFELPVAELRALPIQGTVTFDEARFADVEMRHVQFEIPPPAHPERQRGAAPHGAHAPEPHP